jgi:hypothetical protein
MTIIWVLVVWSIGTDPVVLDAYYSQAECTMALQQVTKYQERRCRPSTLHVPDEWQVRPPAKP